MAFTKKCRNCGKATKYWKKFCQGCKAVIDSAKIDNPKHVAETTKRDADKHLKNNPDLIEVDFSLFNKKSVDPCN